METIAEVIDKHRRHIERSRLPLFSPVCTFCAHYGGQDGCVAFPDGIPKEIWLGQNKHNQPYPGDNGLQFVRVEAEMAA